MKSTLLSCAITLATAAGCSSQPAGHQGHAKGGDPANAMDCCGMMPMAMDKKMASTMPADMPATTAAYVCPMHPEVTSDKPGSCPKCGMALVPAAKGAHDGHH